MPAVSRVSDIGVGVCPCHKVPVGYVTAFVTGSPKTNADGLAVHRVTDVGVASCGHPTVALTGAGKTFADGLKVHRTGDSGVNCGPYASATGSPKTSAS